MTTGWPHIPLLELQVRARNRFLTRGPLNWGVKGQVQGVGTSMNQSSILCPNLSMCIFLHTRVPHSPHILRQVPGLLAFQNPQPTGRSQLCLISPPGSIFECFKVENDRFWLNPMGEGSKGIVDDSWVLQSRGALRAGSGCSPALCFLHLSVCPSFCPSPKWRSVRRRTHRPCCSRFPHVAGQWIFSFLENSAE